jgi:hypothetical protein
MAQLDWIDLISIAATAITAAVICAMLLAV